MRVLIFELDHFGHRLQYVRVLMESLLPWCKDLIFVTSSASAASEEYQIHLQSLSTHFQLDALHDVDRGTPLRGAINKLGNFRATMRFWKPDHAFIPYADGLAQLLLAMRWPTTELDRSAEIEGIMMRGRFSYPPNHWYEPFRTIAWLTAMDLSPITILHHLDPIPYAALRKRGGTLGQRSQLIPEPVEAIQRFEKVEARRKLGLPLEGRYIASMGSQNTRKGTHLLLQAFAQAKLSANDRLLLMGKLDPAIRTLTSEQMGALIRSERLILMDQYVSDEVLGLGLNAVDVVCTPYPRHVGSSGIVVRAAAVERPVLASGFGWVGAVTQAFRLGQTCQVDDLDQFAMKIGESLDLAATFRLSEGGSRFTSFHTLRNFSAHLTARIHARLGHQPTIDLIPWKDVMAAAEPIPTLLSH